jgi:hypothetical protein
MKRLMLALISLNLSNNAMLSRRATGTAEN